MRNGVLRHRSTGVEVAHPERVLVEHAAIACCARNDAGHLARLGRLQQCPIDPLFYCDRHLDGAAVPKAIIPAKAGILVSGARAAEGWVPASAGTTVMFLIKLRMTYDRERVARRMLPLCSGMPNSS